MNSTLVRTITGALFLAVMLAGLLISEFVFLPLVLIAGCIMLHEFYKMTLGSRFKILQWYALIFFVLIAGFSFFSFAGVMSPKYAEVTVVLTVLYFVVYSVNGMEHEFIRESSSIYAGLVYVGLPLSLVGRLVFRDGSFDGLLLLALFVIIWAGDVGAYCIGMLFGQKENSKKLCPSISPKKSWAGLWGGLVFAAAAGALVSVFSLVSFPIWHAVILSILMNIAGVYGDLYESLWKRAAGIKDSGNVIPGHGGLLDRFDSALLAIPAGAVYLHVFSLI